jgi:predicted acylesterase/phospholipase RssA
MGNNIGRLQTSPKAIALCLSGGGLRAFFYHFGTIKALRADELLSRVTHIFSVSGGSILAAHLFVNWDKYCSKDPNVFSEVERKVMAIANRDLRGRVIRPWLLTSITLLLPSRFWQWRVGPTEHLEREYRHLFGSKSFADVIRMHPSAPNLHILTTNLIIGELCSFSKNAITSNGKVNSYPNVT